MTDAQAGTPAPKVLPAGQDLPAGPSVTPPRVLAAGADQPADEAAGPAATPRVLDAEDDAAM
ncbi:hypothetical protein [Streptomyces sp. ISL-11]|uniref:hypothetical protein n=1 Tax=Streptomyces sp. ISL-11 TaxID=2819174 RepID=UPI001BEA0D2D|nr:hypothetical protein [Streptomyces sp. ISL-11]MBT2385450.1 hypothetical protein [Streptomyces sp. ISL-11]